MHHTKCVASHYWMIWAATSTLNRRYFDYRWLPQIRTGRNDIAETIPVPHNL